MKRVRDVAELSVAMTDHANRAFPAVPWDQDTVGKTLKPLESIRCATAAVASSADHALAIEAARINAVLGSASRSYPRCVICLLPLLEVCHFPV